MQNSFIDQGNIFTLSHKDQNYPSNLKRIPDFPKILYGVGQVDLLNRPKVAIVGSRLPTLNNIYLAAELTKFLSQHNIVTISGLAKGIDTETHKNSLHNTVAIVGTGLGKIYPRENLALYRELQKTGLVLSEYEFNSPPKKHHFPRRNRIIAGLADVVVIIEAKKNSGSLITARLALDYNKDIFVVPGHPLDIRSIGSNKLIKDGAIMLLDFNEILDVLNIIYSKQEPVTASSFIEKKVDVDDSKIQKQILSLLSDIPLDIEEIITRLNIDSAELNSNLSSLEMKDYIYRNNYGKIYRRY